ncbi:MAG: 50S ribosomal protein L29 [Gammaproteobacteria bacterium]|nr:50S ribosomal protein L29 [Gammaproteobacteria bacterium]MBP9728523.1 50S ribosomal protein L29 [Gammaproteobacteria bacterium]
MKTAELQLKTVTEIRELVSTLRRTQFKLRLLKSNADVKQTHGIKQARRAIARALTLLAQKEGQAS